MDGNGALLKDDRGISSIPGCRILVSTATYNECANLEELVRGIHQYLPDAHILITDDNSPDGTGELAEDMARKDHRIHVIHRSGKLGLGTAIIAAMRYAIDNDYDYFINVDADLSHHPKYLPQLLDGMKDHDVMIGSRYVAGGGTENWPLSRQVMSKSVNSMVRFLMRIPARDTSGGYRCFRVSKLRQIDFDDIISFGYSFHQEVLYRLWKCAKCRVGEIPIVFADRLEGRSKANVKEMVRSMSVLLYLGLSAMFRPSRS